MAHEITSTDNLLSVREMPWHGLGVVLDDHPTRAEAQALVHPWEPVEAPVFSREIQVTPEGELTNGFGAIPDFKLIQRSDNGERLAIVNDTYQLVTNSEMWDVAEAVGSVGQDIKIETAGSLSGGRKVWALLRFDEPIFIKGDPNGGTLPFLALQNSHDASGAFRAQALNTRIVCANTSAAADAEAKRHGYEFSFRHSSGISERIEEAKAAVSMWREGVQQWQNAMEILVETRITPAQRQEFVERFQPMPPEHLITDRVRNNVLKAREQLVDILHSETCDSIKDNSFGLFQAALEWQQHERIIRGKDNRTRMENHFKRSMMTTDNLRRDTLSLAREVAYV